MQESLAELKDRLYRLNQAIDAGVTSVSYADGRQSYDSREEMIARRTDLERRIARLEGKSGRRVLRLNAKKGL